MFDDLKIRNKLILLVAGPLVIIVLLAALGARSRQTSADEGRTVASLVAVAQANGNVVDALQVESLYSTAYVGSGRKTWAAELKKSRARSDVALQAALPRLQGSARSTSAGFRSASTLAVDAADKLQYIRSTVDQGYRWNQVSTTYGSLQSTFLSVNDTVAESLSDPQVSSQLRTGAALAAYKAAIAQQGSLLVGATEVGSFEEPGSFALLQAAVDDEASRRAIFTSIADTARKGQVRDALTSEGSSTLVGAKDLALARGATAKVGGDPKALLTATTDSLEEIHGVETSLSGSLIARSQKTQTEAERAVNLFLIAAVAAVLVAAAAAVLLGRRITRPLNRLTDAADRLATVQMPRLVDSLRNPSEDELSFQLGSMEAIEVTSDDEIGRLARSFNDVQRVAGEVAAEQAALLRKGIGEMFVNLARRNQALLDRQIDFIDELERGEEDADQLENLYKLDHLATRMRRNAESLLVLAGAEPPRRRGRPAPLANVVRAALAEVEDFGRIELLSFDEILVASNAAADLAHLLSELMENATNFSPPETRVEVVGHRTKADGYVISVTDHGIGMSSEQILDANESLAKPPLVGLALSRSLGFIVVGRLSGRHGIAVRMMPSPSGGVTAVVSLPPSLVTDALGAGAAPVGPSLAEVPPRLKPVLASTEMAPSTGGFAPLEFKPYDEEPAPVAASFADAVPTGHAFDAGLEALVASDPVGGPAAVGGPVSFSGPTTSESGAQHANGLPTRRLSATPGATAPARNGGSGPMAFEPPAPAPPVDAPDPRAEPLFARRAPEPEAAPPAPTFVPDPAPSGRPDLPEPISFGAAPTQPLEVADDAAARLDGPPPAAPTLPSRAATGRPSNAVPAAPASRPFFLDDAAPPRLFGRSPGDEPATASDPAEGDPAESTPPAAVDAAAAPLARRRAPGLPEAPAPVPDGAGSPGIDGGGADGAAVRTTAGLARRTPRQ